MKIIVRKSDNVVTHITPHIVKVLDTAVVCLDKIVAAYSSNIDIFDATPPKDFVGGKYKYVDGAWEENPNYVAIPPYSSEDEYPTQPA